MYIEGSFASNWYLDNIYSTSYAGYVAYVFPSGDIPSNATRVGTVRNSRVNFSNYYTTPIYYASQGVDAVYKASEPPVWEYVRYTPSDYKDEKKWFLMQEEKTPDK